MISVTKVAAIDARLDSIELSGNMVVDIGGGTTVVTVSSWDVVTANSIRVAKDKLGDAINKTMRTYRLRRQVRRISLI